MAEPRTVNSSVPGWRKILARFWPQIWQQRLLLGGATLAMIAEIACRLLEPWPLKFIFDRVIPTAPTGGSSGFATIDALEPLTLLTLCAVALVVIAGMRSLSFYLNRVGFALAGNQVLTACRGELFRHLQRLSLSYHNKARTGDIITRVTGDIGRLKEVVVTAVLPLLIHFITLIAMLAVMTWIDWRLTLMAVPILPLFFLTTRRFGGRIRKVARRQRQREGEIGATTAEAIGSIRVVQALSLEGVHEKTFMAQERASLKEGVQGKRLTARLISIVDILIAIATAAVVWYGARLALLGEMTPGDLIVFLAYLKGAFKPTRNLAKFAGRIAKAAASAERVIEVLETTPLIRNRPGAVDAPHEITTIRFEDVTFGYEPGHLALENFSLEAHRGQVIALVGSSGAGKSTVLNLLLRLYDPQSGRITINGLDLRDQTVETLRPRIAVVPQENVLFAVTVRENIAYGAPGASDEQIEAAAKLTRAHAFITALPQGYETMVGERGETLSEGQRQRIAIARAAIRGAPVLVLDEPTSSLDNKNNELIRDALHELRDNRITFIIAHDLSTVGEADLILFLEKGRVVEQGTHAELIETGGRYANMYALQYDRLENPDRGNGHALRT